MVEHLTYIQHYGARLAHGLGSTPGRTTNFLLDNDVKDKRKNNMKRIVNMLVSKFKYAMNKAFIVYVETRQIPMV